MNTYYVTRIEEPDFGCEGCPEGQEIKDSIFKTRNNKRRNDHIYGR